MMFIVSNPGNLPVLSVLPVLMFSLKSFITQYLICNLKCPAP